VANLLFFAIIDPSKRIGNRASQGVEAARTNAFGTYCVAVKPAVESAVGK
jgi:hypothetical protein